MENTLIIKKALAAHLEFVEVCGDEGYQPMQWERTTSLPEDKLEEFKLSSFDQMFAERAFVWLMGYKEFQSKRYKIPWWERKPTKEIKSMLWELPLRPDTYEEIVNIVEALK